MNVKERKLKFDGKEITFQEFFDNMTSAALSEVFSCVKSLTKKGRIERWVWATKAYYGLERDFQGNRKKMSYTEIAKGLGVSPQRIAVIVNHCLDQIEEKFSSGE